MGFTNKPPVKKTRVDINEIGLSDIMSIEGKSESVSYYQVVVGDFGVILPRSINLDTLEGLQLIKDKASVIHDEGLAKRIATATNGKLLLVKEMYTRKSEEV